MCHFAHQSVIIILLFNSIRYRSGAEFSGYLIALLGTLITVYKSDPWQDHNNFIRNLIIWKLPDFI